MAKTSQQAKPRETTRPDNLVSQYRAIGPSAILAAVLSTVRQHPQVKFASVVQETD
jgi:hypothetical protein